MKEKGMYRVFMVLSFVVLNVLSIADQPVRHTSHNYKLGGNNGVDVRIIDKTKAGEIDKTSTSHKTHRVISFKPLPYPVNFSFYDVNGDDKISMRELIEVTGPAENAYKAFSASDLNGDGFVTEAEYAHRPWGYSKHDVVLTR